MKLNHRITDLENLEFTVKDPRLREVKWMSSITVM